ncbi:alpha/beta hydrolase [Actinosynnema sp. ALI-1.44]|uniref:alpha/beta hydrolase n=1 Tax=Actinosynnema sp. ALI-1.44 TaxID=1933779 RepID=UPI000A000A8B|nr:alpha/beta hydrolase-fold protein [Actinosynnema sp. ALI-1.44]
MLDTVLDWDLVNGKAPIVATVVAVLACCALLVRRDRRWWTRTIPILVAVSVAVTLLAWWLVEGVWQPFPDALPLRVVGWTGCAVAGVGLGVVSLWKTSWRRRVAAVVVAVLAVVASMLNINAYYGQYPSLRGALGMPPANEIPFTDLTPPTETPFPSEPGRPLIDSWKPPPNMPKQGKVTQATIPSPISKFPTTRQAYLYLPPAYLTDARPLLPVLVALPGQPGGPTDWINGGQIAATMDRYAAAHNGLAPIVVMPDATGSALNNPLCVDSKLGANETYLTRDVPDWIRQNLQVDPDARHWAVAGFSYGGTCALQLALRQPQVYPTFVDISGQQEPSLGTREKTVKEIFDGDEAAFRAINPLDLLATRKYPDSAGAFTVGSVDAYLPQQKVVYDAALRNGLAAEWFEVPGPHNWHSWAAGFVKSLDWLTSRMGLTR